MKRFLGALFVFIGVVIILTNLFPGYANYLAVLSAITRLPFWGVTLVLTGAYLFLTNERARTATVIVLIVFVGIYLMALGANTTGFDIGGWSIPAVFWGNNRIEGETHLLGEYDATNIEVSDLAARIDITTTEGEATKVTTNLPLQAGKSGNELLIKCKDDCRNYKNGKLTLAVGKEVSLEDLKIRDTVGDININLSNNVNEIDVKNFVGELRVKRLKSKSLSLAAFIGDVELEISSLEGFTVKNGIGDINIKLPENLRVEVTSESMLSKLNTEGNVYQGDRSLEYEMRNIIGRVKIKKDEDKTG